MEKVYFRKWEEKEGELFYISFSDGYERPTGMFDKNGREIYENDIIKIETKDGGYLRTGIVRFGTGYMDSGVYAYRGFYIDSPKFDQEQFSEFWRNTTKSEVIGNIHETVEHKEK